MKQRDPWDDVEKGKEEDYFLRKHREWLEKKQQGRTGQKAGKNPDEDLACPRCNKMLEVKPFRETVIYECEACGGGWLDQESLKSLWE